MGFKTFTCKICGLEGITKRNSFSLKSLGIGEGRACRIHEQVIKAVKDQEDKKLDEKVFEIMQVISLTALVRTQQFLNGMPPSLIYYNLRGKGISKRIIDEVKLEVEKQGEMTSEQAVTSLLAYNSIKERVS